MRDVTVRCDAQRLKPKKVEVASQRDVEVVPERVRVTGTTCAKPT